MLPRARILPPQNPPLGPGNSPRPAGRVPEFPFESLPLLAMMNRADALSASLRIIAEREGFEPSIRFPACRFSKPVLSTTQPPLQKDQAPDKVPHFRGHRKYAIFRMRPYRLVVRTAPFQGVNPGSIPGRVMGKIFPE